MPCMLATYRTYTPWPITYGKGKSLILTFVGHTKHCPLPHATEAHYPTYVNVTSRPYG